MSSAAVQSHQPKQTTPNPRDPYPTSSPSSRRNGRSSAPNVTSPQHATYSSPGTSGTASPRMTEPLSSSTYQQFYPESAVPGPAIALPIRTSSQNAPTTAGYDGRGYQHSTAQAGGDYGTETDQQRGGGNAHRQQAQRSPRDDGRSQQTRQAPTQSLSPTTGGRPPVEIPLPRENSAIIQRIVVNPDPTDRAREEAAESRLQSAQAEAEGASTPVAEQSGTVSSEQRRSRQEFRQSTNRREVRFGDYCLGNTIGEGEFAKVKLGWKKGSSVQVAIKLMRKESLKSSSDRLPKIYREISVLRELQHSNIVRLHEFVETERHMGIILEYASGGELFDYILKERYLEEERAQKLFAQLVSGVGYLHAKGIVHRDLKLENLLLDSEQNIIITDFGFANTFDPTDELSEEIVLNLRNKDFVKRHKLDKVNEKNQRRGDIMQTSCGSPCYAAPELVTREIDPATGKEVTDDDGRLYTACKVDVWSCGVILYAMLAGYLPFDDDPENPEGDDIPQLYKYINETKLTFPGYVEAQAKDLLGIILVPKPLKRADLFMVARHSWLSRFSAHVGFIGSCATTADDIAASALELRKRKFVDDKMSSRELAGRNAAPRSGSAGGPARQTVESAEAASQRAQERDAKRRTVQLEYVPPKNETPRGEAAYVAAQAPIVPLTGARTRARGDAQGPVEVSPAPPRTAPVTRKGVPSQNMPPPATRPKRDQARATSESTTIPTQSPVLDARPNTSGAFGTSRLPSRGNSYSQPVIATPTTTTAQGRFSQPKSNSTYMMTGPIGADQFADGGRPASQQHLGQQGFAQSPTVGIRPGPHGHKRSSTLGSIGDRLLGRSNSRRRDSQLQDAHASPAEKRDRKYPPVSMRNAMGSGNGEQQPRPSTESTRRPSFSFNRKTSEGAPADGKRNSRRFSFLPSFTGKKEQSFDPDPYGRRPESKSGPGALMAFGRGASRSPSRSTTNSTIPLYYEPERDAARSQRRSDVPTSYIPSGSYNQAIPPQPMSSQSYQSPPLMHRKQWRDDGYGSNRLDNASPTVVASSLPAGLSSGPSEKFYGSDDLVHPNLPQQQQQQQQQQQRPPQSAGNYSYDGSPGPENPNLRPTQRKFVNEYDHGYGGSSSATRRVMDFFRRRGRDRNDS